MPVLTANIAPFIDEVFTITSVWWEEPRNHRGLDITTGQNSPLYSMCNGIVVFSGAQTDGQGNLTGYGYYIIIKDIATKMGFLYAHMREQSFLSVGDNVYINGLVGYEGTTGDSTGIHLHLEMQDLTNHDWVYGAPKSYYTNPALFMGIPNEEGIQAIYHASSPPTPPTPPFYLGKGSFPWVLYARKFRERGLNE